MKIYDMIDSIQNTVYILVQNIRKDKKEKKRGSKNKWYLGIVCLFNLNKDKQKIRKLYSEETQRLLRLF